MTDTSVELPSREPTLRVVPLPADVNQNGDIFGGWVMSQVDIAGSIPASHRARGRVATVAVNSFVFKQPVMIGDVVSFYATITRVGRTSITVDVEVYAQRNPGRCDLRQGDRGEPHVCCGWDPDRRPRELPAGVSGCCRAVCPKTTRDRAVPPTRQRQPAGASWAGCIVATEMRREPGCRVATGSRVRIKKTRTGVLPP